MEHRTISKGEIVYSCRRQNRDNIWTVFTGVYALKVIMEGHITSINSWENRTADYVTGKLGKKVVI